jgi:dUTP pyrophosphatase
MFNIELMKERVLEIADPNNPYSQEDFNEEFNMGTIAVNPDAHKVQFAFKNESSNPNPEYATNGSSGFDLRANLTDDVKIKSGDIAIVPTGLYFKIPDNFEIQVRPRSGLAAKNGVTVLNTPGTVDADYRGEIKVILINHGKETFTIQHGDRIAQAVVASVFAKNVVHLLQVDNVSDDTERGSGGFGSTGLK